MHYFLVSLILTFVFFGSALSQTAKPNDLLKRLIDLPAPPPGGPASQEPETETPERPDEFYRLKNMPPDDAPIEDLLAYWKGASYRPSQVLFERTASARTAERLLDHILDHVKDNPNLIHEYLGAMPTDERTAASIRELYKAISAGENSYAGTQLREWLTNNTRDGIESLTKKVRKIRDQNDYVSNEFQVALKALAKLDWDLARPHVERLEFDASNPHSKILAYWVRYSRAIAEKESSDIDSYRRKLQDVVEDRSARWSQRDLAMDALVDGGEWDGRQDWYLSLFADETLLQIQENGYTGMTTMLNAAASTQEWMEKFLKMVRSDNKAIRSAAARNLIDIYRDQQVIIEALLPWVADPNWAKESRSSERGKVIEGLGDHDVPGAVPALITVLANEQVYRQAAAIALAKKKDLRAAPILRSLIPKESGEIRQALIAALVACGGMTADEQMTSVEAYAVMSSTTEGVAAIEKDSRTDYSEEVEEDETVRTRKSQEPSPIPVEVLIGKVLAEIDEPDEGLAVRAIDREKALRPKDPAVAARLAEIIGGWKGRAIYLEQLRKMRSGEADLGDILGLLAERALVNQKLPNEVASLRSASGITRGIGACIAEGPDEFLSIIGSGDPESQVAMLGCARLLRVKLPVGEVAGLLESANPMIRLAGERYLESEDSVVARRLVLAKHPGEARILGSYSVFIPEPRSIETYSDLLQAVFTSVGATAGYGSSPNLRKFETKLQTEIKNNKDLVGIFARLPEAVAGQQVVRVYKDRVTYTFYEDMARFWTRDLTEKEYKDLRGFILVNKIDELPPLRQACYHGCPSGEFVMLGRDGGRRNFFSGYQLKDALAGLDNHFEAFQAKDLKLNYHLMEKIKGLEVIVADSKFPVHAAWKGDSELRFLVSDTELARSIESDLAEKTRVENEVEIDDIDEEEAGKQRAARYERQEKRRVEALGKELSWRTLTNGKVGPVVAQPAEVNLLPAMSAISPAVRPQVFRSPSTGNVGEDAVYANRYSGGIFKLNASGEPTVIKRGDYNQAVVSADKKWVLATKYGDDDKMVLVRLNLQTGQEFNIGVPSSEPVFTIGFVASHNRMLVYRGDRTEIDRATGAMGSLEVEIPDEDTPAAPATKNRTKGEYSLVDPATGATRAVKGEFGPIEAPRHRPLQTSSTAGAVWAAIYDSVANTTRIGLYSEKTFSFIPIAILPDIRLDTSDVWVHEKENRIYFLYQGHLLAAPLRQP